MPRQRVIHYGAVDLEEFLKVNMYHLEFEHPVTSDLGWTKTRLTRFINEPENMQLKHVKQLSKFLFETEDKAGMLYTFFNCGKDRLTRPEIDAICSKIGEVPELQTAG